ncbi:MAG: hypothetical protein KOO66_04215 [Bacteroidales bacterium]|nr:hypothetical protein [Bacteroidales bacterium]
MTLLITTISKDYALSSSDMRITIKTKDGYKPVDEKFNKHILFHSNGLTANITYTGVAQWFQRGKKVKLYDVISESLATSSKNDLNFAPLSLNLINDIVAAISPNILKSRNFGFELHITGYHNKTPIPFIAVISTFQEEAPWNTEGELQWEYDIDGVKIFIKATEEPDVIISGMSTAVTQYEKYDLINAVNNGADAFNISNLSSQIIKNASKRTLGIGPRSVSMLMPKSGYVDSNLWDKNMSGIIGYLPRMVLPNGKMFGPSEFPVELDLILHGRLPRDSLFFKTVIYNNFKRRDRRIIFKQKHGELIPGIFGIIQLNLYGKVAEGYTDFGLSH